MTDEIKNRFSVYPQNNNEVTYYSVFMCDTEEYKKEYSVNGDFRL